jgi:hypothetical protein
MGYTTMTALTALTGTRERRLRTVPALREQARGTRGNRPAKLRGGGRRRGGRFAFLQPTREQEQRGQGAGTIQANSRFEGRGTLPNC